MKTNIFLLLAGIIVSYCFTSMILNARIVNPFIVFTNSTLVFDRDELYADMKDFEVIAENQLRSTSKKPWIEVTNISNRIEELRTVVYRVKPIVNAGEENTVVTELYYADTEQEYNSYRRITHNFTGDTTVITIPHYAGPIDKLRLNLTVLDDTILEITEISLNTDALFSFPLFILIYIIWLLIIFVDMCPHSNIPKKKFCVRHKRVLCYTEEKANVPAHSP